MELLLSFIYIMQVGHTFLPNDRIFGNIEQCRNKQPVFLPEQWRTVLEAAIVESDCEIKTNWYNDQAIFKNYSDFCDLKYSITSSRNIVGYRPVKKVKITEHFWINFGWADEWDAEAAEKSGFEHFMMKEIHEQPKAVQDTLNSVIKNQFSII